MSTWTHYLPAIYILILGIGVPAVVAILWHLVVRHQTRKAREAIERANRVHSDWLEASKRSDNVRDP